MEGIINDLSKKKVVDYLKNIISGKILLLFPHGLGDLILFMPIVEELKRRFPRVNIKIGGDGKRGFGDIIGDNFFSIDGFGDYRKILRQFSYVFNIQYPEPDMKRSVVTIQKPYLCNSKEIGLEDFVWKPYRLKVELKNENSKTIGVHFFGNTNSRHKNPTETCASRICKEIKEVGYIPFEVHMIHHFTKDQNLFIGNNLFGKENSLRSEKPNVQTMINKIVECKYFVGVDSGPLYLAGSILGFDKVIGVQKYLEIGRYLPIEIPKIDVRYYKPRSIFNELKRLENGND
jgi:ADP-heptose:LPS heptosyltransferase